MNDFQKFVESIEKYIENKSTDKLTTLFNQIKGLSCNDFRLYYFKAAYYNKTEEHLAKAKENIDKSLELVDRIEESAPGVENGVGLWYSYPDGNSYCLPLISIKQQLIEVYSTAGEIYAKLQDNDNSLSAYKKVQYYTSFLKSDFENCKTVSLFSFRRYGKYSLSDLKENKITVSPSKNMNDPFDSIINLWANEEHLAQKCKDKSHAKPYAKSFDYFRIRSFCYGNEDEVVKKSLMWSHYADEHKGFCIKYKLSTRFIKQEENEKFEHSYLKKIKYTENPISIDTPTIDTTLAFATKSIEWSYENEVRLIDFNPNEPNDYLGIPLDNMSYIEAIYFGYRCKDDIINEVIRIFNKNEHQPIFFKMKLDTRDVHHMQIVQL